MPRRRCDICKIDNDRRSFAKHFRSTKHLKKMRPDDINIPEQFFRDSLEIKFKKIHNPKPFRQIATDTIRLDEKNFN